MIKNHQVVTGSTLNPVLDTDEVAKLLAVSASLVNKWRIQGRGPRYFKLGRAVRYRIEDIELWLARNQRDGGGVQ